MSKVLWHTMIVKVPAEMVDFTPKGKVSVKKTLTKMGSIAKSQKKPSIQIMPSKDGEVHVIEGKKVNVTDLKDTMKKVKELEKKNKGRDIFAKEPKESFSTKVKKYARNLVLDKKTRPSLPPLSEGAKWENKKLYEDLKKAHKLMDDKNPLGWKASIDGLADAKEKLSQSSSLSADHEIFQHNVKYFQNLVRKNKALLTKDFGTLDANQKRLSAPIASTTWDRSREEEERKTMEQEDVSAPKQKPEPTPEPQMGILQKRRAERKEKEKQEQERIMMEQEDVPAPKPAPKQKPKPVPVEPSILATKKFLKELEYLKKEDIDFILKNELYEDTANDINNLRSMISYYIESSQIKEEVVDSIKDLMERSKRDSLNFAEWKNFMKKPIMNTINALKIPTRKELIRKNYAEITLEDIDFIVDHDLEHEDISKMDMVRYKQKLEKAYKLPKFDTRAERIAYMKDEPERKIKRIKEIVKPEADDSPIIKKWKTAQFVFMTS